MSQKNKKISLAFVISIATLVASFLTSFLFTKYLLSRPQIGDINFGLKTTADSLISFVTALTLGMASTFIRFHKKYENKEEDVFTSFNLITTIIAGLVVLFGVIVCVLTINNKILDPNKGVYTEQQVFDFLLILIISILFTSLTIILSNSKWYLQSTKHIVSVRLINLIVVILYPIVATIFVHFGANMVIVTLIYSVIYLASFIFYLFYRIKIVKSVSFLKISKINKSLTTDILIYSLFVILTSFMETFNQSTDKLIITVSLSASLTTMYQLSMTLNQFLLSLADIIYSPHIPYMAEDVVIGNKKGIQKTYDKVNTLLMLISFLIFVGFVSCGREFVRLWVGEGKDFVYYFTSILFAAWPLYGMTRFSTVIHRLTNKHYKSSLIYVISFVIHLIISFSLIQLIGIWACVIGTISSTLFISFSFLIYNKKELELSQKNYLKNLLLLVASSSATLLLTFAFTYLIKRNFESLSDMTLLLIKGSLSIIFFTISIVIIYRKNIFEKIKAFFNDEHAQIVYDRPSSFTKISYKLRSHKEKINRFFPYVFIIYFLLNFSSYYLGGIAPIKYIVTSSFFTLGTKITSYLILIVYSIVLAIANEYAVKKNYIFTFIFIFLISLLSTIYVPKNVTFITQNNFNISVRTTLKLGVFDLILGNFNFLIDLIIMFFYTFLFRQSIFKKDLLPFFRFIVVFTLIQIIYTFIFQYNDYLYYFGKVAGQVEFTGYDTNLSGTFQSKNGFGFLLFQSILACCYLIKHEKKYRVLFWLCFVLINIVNIFSLSKTAMLSSFIFVAIIFFYWLIEMKKNNKKRAIIIFSMLFAIILFSFLLFTPLFRKVSFIDSIVDKISSIFFVSGRATIKSRIIIWEYALKLVKGPYIIFGYGKNASAAFLRISSDFRTQTFHNGILDILCSYGVFGLLLYFYAISYVYSKNVESTIDSFTKVFVVAVIVTTLLYGMMEDVYLLISSSSVMLVPNLILATGVDKEKTKNEGDLTINKSS